MEAILVEFKIVHGRQWKRPPRVHLGVAGPDKRTVYTLCGHPKPLSDLLRFRTGKTRELTCIRCIRRLGVWEEGQK